MSDIDPTQPTQTTPSQGGKLVYLQEENPYSLGEEKPYKPPQSDKKPQFAISACSSGPVGLWLYPACLFRCFGLLKYHCFPLQLILSWGSLRPSQALPIDCRVLLLSFPILLTVPCVLSLINHCCIRHASPPPRAIEGVRGIHP
jgi:hypothetical protein